MSNTESMRKLMEDIDNALKANVDGTLKEIFTSETPEPTEEKPVAEETVWAGKLERHSAKDFAKVCEAKYGPEVSVDALDVLKGSKLEEQDKDSLRYIMEVAYAYGEDNLAQLIEEYLKEPVEEHIAESILRSFGLNEAKNDEIPNMGQKFDAEHPAPASELMGDKDNELGMRSPVGSVNTSGDMDELSQKPGPSDKHD